MFEGEIIFYNGFNLFIDVIIALIAFSVAYRWGKDDGYDDGMNQGYSLALSDVEDRRVVAHNGDWIVNYVPVLGTPESK